MKNILIVDDDYFMVKVCKTKFEAAGYKVTAALDGNSAIKSLSATPPDLVLLDLILPEMDGVAILDFIRSHEKLRGLPVIVVSGCSHFSGTAQAAWAAGATHFVKKGDYSPTQIVDLVDEALSASPEKVEPAPSPERPGNRNVLVADDDRLIHGVCDYFLTQGGFTVASAFDGRQALEMALANPPGLMVLDGLMPGMDGAQVMEEWNAHSVLASIPVIMLTSVDDEETKAEMAAKGVVDYIVKPFSPDQLVKLAARHTGTDLKG